MKKWYLSKTLWVNWIAVAAVVLQVATGVEITPAELQAGLIPLINLILRFVTREELGV